MSNCELCGEPMPKGEEMFKYHGYSGNCPKPSVQQNHKDCDDTCQAKIIEQAVSGSRPQPGKADTPPPVSKGERL